MGLEDLQYITMTEAEARIETKLDMWESLESFEAVCGVNGLFAVLSEGNYEV